MYKRLALFSIFLLGASLSAWAEGEGGAEVQFGCCNYDTAYVIVTPAGNDPVTLLSVRTRSITISVDTNPPVSVIQVTRTRNKDDDLPLIIILPTVSCSTTASNSTTAATSTSRTSSSTTTTTTTTTTSTTTSSSSDATQALFVNWMLLMAVISTLGLFVL